MSEQRELFPFSLDEIDAIMVGDDAARLAELRTLLKERQMMSDDDIDRVITARKLRQMIHVADEAALEQRMVDGPEPSEEEQGMRAFAENLESPVREAVFTLRRKGYDTFSSGFSDFDWQSLSFSGPVLVDLLVKHRAALEQLSVTVDADGRGVSFRPSSIDAETIRNTWNQIADILPDRGTVAPRRTQGGTAQFNAWERSQKK